VSSLVLLHLLSITCLVTLSSILERLLLFCREFTPHFTEFLGDICSGGLRTIRVILLETGLSGLAVKLLELHEGREGALWCVGVLLTAGAALLALLVVVLLASLLVMVMVVVMVVVVLLVMSALLCRRAAFDLLGVAGRLHGGLTVFCDIRGR